MAIVSPQPDPPPSNGPEKRFAPPELADVIVVGASVRALAFSALRAGLLPLAVDLFGDTDLRSCCPSLRVPVDSWPRSAADAIRRLPHRPIIYTGGLENHAEIVGRLAGERPLWGNEEPVLRRVRDPYELRDRLLAAGLSSPATSRERRTPRNGSWIEKPLRGSGGSRIRRAAPGAPIAADAWLQEFVAGHPVSLVGIADERGARCLGLTRQLVGEPWLHAPEWSWCGNIAPFELLTKIHQRLEQGVGRLAQAVGLRGLFGLDLVIDAAGQPHTIELNPRYTGATEVVERWLGTPLLVAHRRAFDSGRASTVPEDSPSSPTQSRLFDDPAPTTSPPAATGKAVLFAPHPLRVSRRLVAPKGCWLADLPPPGTQIAAGRPIVSIFCDGASAADCEARLRASTREVEELLFRSR